MTVQTASLDISFAVERMETSLEPVEPSFVLEAATEPAPPDHHPKSPTVLRI
jgi:hypothetical protein